jgi:hypothetical protein
VYLTIWWLHGDLESEDRYDNSTINLGGGAEREGGI